MKAIRTGLSSLAVVALTSCASIQVRSDYDHQASFRQLATYSWVDSEPGVGGHPAFGGPLVERRIRGVVDTELARRGYRKVTSDPYDFQIAYHVVAEERATAYSSYGYGPYYGSRPYYGHHRFGGRHYGRHGYGLSYGSGYGLGYGSSYLREYLEGTIILDIIDARSGELIWRGWAKGELAANPKPEQVHEYIKKAVREVLDEFPPERGRRVPALAP